MTRNKKKKNKYRKQITADCDQYYEQGKKKPARDNQWWLQMCRSRDPQREWHLSWELNGRKESAPCKLEGRVFLSVNLTGAKILQRKHAWLVIPGPWEGTEYRLPHPTPPFPPTQLVTWRIKKLHLKSLFLIFLTPIPMCFIFWEKKKKRENWGKT